MSPSKIELKPVEHAEIQFLIDNYVDTLLPNQECVMRPPMSDDQGAMKTPLLAEHGLSLLIRTHEGDASRTVLMDGGVSVKGLLHNVERLEADLSSVEAVFLSHGHVDHRAALAEMIERTGKKDLPVHFHPDAYLNRRAIMPDGKHHIMPPFQEERLIDAGAQLTTGKEPKLLGDGTMALTGQIERKTDFEKGFPIHYCEREGELEPDPWIWDDQSLIIHVRNKGLVVVSGCGHSGIVNTVHHARELTGVQDVLAIMGGFHLTGGIFEPIIDPTVEALTELNPRWIIPTHCTGWKAVRKFQEEFPEQFIQNSVGTTYQF